MMIRFLLLLVGPAVAAAFPLKPALLVSRPAPVVCCRAQQDISSARRNFLSDMFTLPVILGPSLAFADSTGKFSSKRTAKNRYVPRIKKGVAAFEVLESGGDGSSFSATLDDMVSAMKLYGQANRRGELPDKISQRLEADAAKFDEAAKKGDQAGMRAVLDKYFEDLPKDGKEPFGSGKAAE